MNLRLYRVSSAAVLALAAAAYLVLSIVAPFLPVRYCQSRAWRGYAAVLFHASELPDGIEEQLRLLPGVRGVVSERTAPAEFHAFDGMERVTVDRLPARLEARDPRFDPYLRQLERYFRLTRGGAPCCAVYLRTSVSPYLLQWRLRPLAEKAGVRYSLPDFDPARRLAGAGLAAALLLVMAARRPRRAHPGLLAAAALPWLANAIAGEAVDLAAFLLVLPGMSILLEDWTRRMRETVDHGRREAGGSAGRRLAAALCAAGLGLLLAGARQPWPLLFRLAVAAGLNLTLPFIARLFRRRTVRLTAHLPFEALPILRRRRVLGRPAVADLVRMGIPAALMAASLLAGLAAGPVPPSVFPVPLQAREQGPLSWAALQALHSDREAAALPDLSDFVAHAAFQQGFPFGRPYSFPVPGERIYLTSYSEAAEGRGIAQNLRAVKRYEPGWLTVTLETIDPQSVEGMLLAQGRAVAVVPGSYAHLEAASLPGWKMALLALLWIACLIVQDLKTVVGTGILTRHFAPGGSTP